MKKLVCLTLVLMLALCALLPAMAEEVPTIHCGVLSMLNLTEEEMLNYRTARNLIGRQLEKEGLATHQFRQILGVDNWKDAPFEIVYFDSLDAALMALNAGRINEISIYETVAQYLTHSDPSLVQIVTINEGAEDSPFVRRVREALLANDFAFMFMKDNEALRDEFNAALQAITEEEMNQLVQEHITAAINGDEISPIQMPVIEGAETIRVAVTGALPPMDYVAADGTPAGFNTALLAEISKRTGKNIELVTVDSIGRAAALASGTVDAVFWTRTSGLSNSNTANSEEERAKKWEDIKQELTEDEIETLEKVSEMVSVAGFGRADMPENTIITEPYFSDFIVPVTTQARLDAATARANQ